MGDFHLKIPMRTIPSQQQIDEAIKLLTQHENFPIVRMVQVEGVWVSEYDVRSRQDG